MMALSSRYPAPGPELYLLVTKAKDWALGHGIMMRTESQPESQEVISYAPFMLYPTPMPRSCFEQALAVQTDYNLLMHRVAYDDHFLYTALKGSIEQDDFMKRLWHIHTKVRDEGSGQSLCLQVNRSDYILHVNSDTSKAELKQVEFNTISSAFSALAAKVTGLHRYVLDSSNLSEYTNSLPNNEGLNVVALALLKAWKLYANPQAVVMFLVEDVLRNIYDQHWIEWQLHELNSSVKVIRRTFRQLASTASLDKDRNLIVDGQEVAIVYYRDGYVPQQLPTEMEWGLKLLIERSRAIKCPNIQYHLAGSKKIQQVLAEENTLTRFVEDPAAVKRLSDTFAQLYSLDFSVAGEAAVELALSNPEQYVMKPQREGGGNNIYGEDIRKLLNKIRDKEERVQYILMQRLTPRVNDNYLLKPGEPAHIATTTVSELGVYGVFIATPDKVYENYQQGHLLRTKHTGVDEGGVAAGYSGVDSPFLTD